MNPEAMMIHDWKIREEERARMQPTDRVSFIIPRTYPVGDMKQRDRRIGALLYRAFGIPMHVCYDQPWEDMHIICRTDQFARFLIWRNEVGLCNGFKELKPELLTPSCSNGKTYDVTRN